jgi:hypothetical protein
VIQGYQTIYEATSHIGESFVLYHQKEKELPEELQKLNHFTFTDAIITQYNYIPLGFNLIPGNNHFPLLDFAVKHPTYDYYWCVEDDVRFSGNWTYFFEAFSHVNADFISSHIRTVKEEPQWHWWHALANPYKFIPFEKRIRSFNPIYRISKTALTFIYHALQEHWCGHHEVLFPTLLKEKGFEIMDFGGKGQFVPPEFENKFYIANSPNSRGMLTDGTMRWRPSFGIVGEEKNKLYHPVKDS